MFVRSRIIGKLAICGLKPRGIVINATTRHTIPKPPDVKALVTQADMQQAREWITSFEAYPAESLPRDAMEVTFNRSSGPGGQNVNKRSTKVTIKLLLSRTQHWLPSYVRENAKESPYYSAGGTGPNGPGRKGSLESTPFLLFSSSDHRTQPQNLQDCQEKLKNAILHIAGSGLTGTTSIQQVRKVQRLISQEKRRIEIDKRMRSKIKQHRKAVQWD